MAVETILDVKNYIEETLVKIKHLKTQFDVLQEEIATYNKENSPWFFYQSNDFLRNIPKAEKTIELFKVHEEFLKNPNIEIGQVFFNLTHNKDFIKEEKYLVVEYKKPMVKIRRLDLDSFLYYVGVHTAIEVHESVLLQKMLYVEKIPLSVAKYQMLLSGVADTWDEDLDQKMAIAEFHFGEDHITTSCVNLTYDEIFGLYADIRFISHDMREWTKCVDEILDLQMPDVIKLFPIRDNTNSDKCVITFTKSTEREGYYDYQSKGEFTNGVPRTFFNEKPAARKLMLVEKEFNQTKGEIQS